MDLIFLADGFEETEAITPWDILKRAGEDIRTVSLREDRTATGSHQMKVVADLTLSEAVGMKPDLIILPGGMPGAKHLRENTAVCAMVTEATARGALIGAICAAPYVLGELGLLKGKQATCFPGFEDHLTGAILSEQKVVRDGNIITAAGMGVALPFGLALAKARRGAETADKIAASIQKEAK